MDDIPSLQHPGFLARSSRSVLRVLGWRLCLTPPPGRQAVVAVYPHTSNWDFPLGLLTRWGMGLKARWAGKDTLFAGPAGAVFRALGGIPVNRRERTGLVGALAALFREEEALFLAIAPEGTRSHVDHWKSGFYRVAVEAGVPIGLGFLDYGRRECGVTVWLEPTGDEAADLAAIRAFYADKRGLHPENQGEIRFKPAQRP